MAMLQPMDDKQLIQWVRQGNPLEVDEQTCRLLSTFSIRDFYMDEYPEDTLGEELNDISFMDVLDGLNAGEDIYDVIGVGDSIIREGIFTMLSTLLNVDYDVIYYLWLSQGN